MKIDDEYYRTHKPRGCIFNCITALARIFGLITLAGLAFVTYLEWLGMDVWNFRIYITSEACFYWLCCIPIDNWLKTIIYVALSIPFFVPTWLSPIIRTDVKIVGALLSFTGVLYFIKTFKYKRSNTDEPQEDDSIFHASNPSNRPSTSTQTSIIGINNDNLSSTFTIDQEMNKNH
ncbi:unnamed protein product [Rotaria sp. Silwood2]|nr:unnamed protein product [Rotaria sp. Silwood2]CAF4026257.1 unnamed protein product [Rotaria sp. Silwood2]CAF4126506.1 unnamed protein product [Rotaria sp. Silwood2]